MGKEKTFVNFAKEIKVEDRKVFIGTIHEYLGPSWQVFDIENIPNDCNKLVCEKTEELIPFCLLDVKFRDKNVTIKQVAQSFCKNKNKAFPYKKRKLFIGKILWLKEGSLLGNKINVCVHIGGI